MSNSLTEAQITSWSDENKGETRCFVYTGSSMTPTFRPGQLLYVCPKASDIVPGDIIVFESITGNGYVVHRVVSTAGMSLITRGDNNSQCDILPVIPNQIVGRVESLGERGHIKPVLRGSPGFWSVWIRQVIYRVEGWLRWILRRPYRLLRNFALIRQILSRLLSGHLEVVHLKTPDGPLFKTTFRGHTIACWRPRQNRFECRRPFDLIISRPDKTE